MPNQKITISLDPAIAKKLRLDSIEKYGDSRSLSRLIEDLVQEASSPPPVVAAEPVDPIIIRSAVRKAWMAVKDDATTEAYKTKFQGKLSEPAPEGGERPKAGVKEVVMLQCSSATGESFMMTADILRTEGANPKLSAWVRSDTALGQGRFMFDLTPLAQRQ